MSSDTQPQTGVPGPLFILSGPSGVGKTTILRELIQKEGFPLHQSISATTRAPRSGEIDGRDYHFLSACDFESELAAGGFLESAQVHGQRYGTLKREVEGWRKKGFGVVLAIDVQGAEQVRAKTRVDCSVFLTAPEEVLRERLNHRATDAPEVIEKRLANARLEFARAGEYTRVITNSDLSQAVSELAGLWRPYFNRE